MSWEITWWILLHIECWNLFHFLLLALFFSYKVEEKAKKKWKSRRVNALRCSSIVWSDFLVLIARHSIYVKYVGVTRLALYFFMYCTIRYSMVLTMATKRKKEKFLLCLLSTDSFHLNSFFLRNRKSWNRLYS